MINHLDILLGLGGNGPGLAAYGTMSGQLENILSLPAGQSVYTIDISPDGKVMAVGTKTGDVHWLTPGHTNQQDPGYLVKKCANGAPVLSLCFVDSSTMAVSDTIGRLLLWPLTEDGQPTRLPTSKRIICSLVRLDHEHLAGLSLPGELIVWNLTARSIVGILEVPSVPRDLCGLVRPVYWPVADSWVWAGQDGVIVRYKWPQNKIHAVHAHSGDIYVNMICNDELLTIGRVDGCLERWQVGRDEPIGSYDAPHGVISGALWGGQEAQMILINDAGKAGLYSWTGSALNLIKWLPGLDYRIAYGPSIENFRSAIQHQRTHQARNIVKKALEQIEKRAWDELEAPYQQLDELGFHHVALALRGLEARGKEDLTAELRAHHELARIIPHREPGSQKSLLRYAGLLETVWQPQKARAIYRQLMEIYPDNSVYADGVRRISDYWSVIEGGGYVIETDIPLLSLVKSATITDEKFRGRYLVKNMPPINCSVVISASDFVTKYTQNTQSKPQLPQAVEIPLWWLWRDKADKVAMVIFKERDPVLLRGLEFGIKFVDAGLQTVLIWVVLFNAEETTRDESVDLHNQSMYEQLQRIEDHSLSNDGWLQMVQREAGYAIRQLMTRKLADRNR